MSLSIGIVGLPNVGKSTLFNALTKKQVEASNYPFCTIEPNVGVVKVPDERLEKIAEASKPEKILPTAIEFVDIAGLVKNAHKGEGLGNQFLSHIREVDAICEVVREFKDENIAHVDGQVDGERDRETIELELIMADLKIVDKRFAKIAKEIKSGNKEILKQKELLEKLKKTLESGEPLQKENLSDEEKNFVKDLSLLTLKPVLYVNNVGEESKGESDVLSLNFKLEQEISELTAGEQKELDLKSDLDRLIKASYELLDIITFFTVQNKILQAWTIPRNTKAPLAAGRIHGDMEAGFIRAEVIGWKELVEAGNEQAAREKGLIRTEGREYEIKDGDICHFLFNK